LICQEPILQAFAFQPRNQEGTFAILPTSPSALRLSFDAVFYHASGVDACMAFYPDTIGFPLISYDYI
jgi:hypothetical protein